jgi:mitofusin
MFLLHMVLQCVCILLLFAERMSALLPADKKQISLNVLPRREPFEILYRLNCDNLCADFHEDLEFRFSWGLTSIISRFAGKKSSSLAITNYSQRVSAL